MTSVTTFLWFDTEAEEAANYYTSLFDDGNVIEVRHSGTTGPRPAGMVLEVDFELAGQSFTALNGGSSYRFNEAVSIMFRCDTAEEVDRYWSRLTDGGEEGPCGWLKDKYGLSWQIFPTLWFELVSDPDPVKSDAAMAAMLKMRKIDSRALQEAFDNA